MTPIDLLLFLAAAVLGAGIGVGMIAWKLYQIRWILPASLVLSALVMGVMLWWRFGRLVGLP